MPSFGHSWRGGLVAEILSRYVTRDQIAMTGNRVNLNRPRPRIQFGLLTLLLVTNGAGIYVWLAFKFPWLIVAGIAAPIVYWLMWREDFDGIRSGPEFKKNCGAREALDAEGFHQRYYSGSDISIALIHQFLTFLEREFDEPAGKFRPTDDLWKIVVGDSDSVLIEAIEKEFEIRIDFRLRPMPDSSFDSTLRQIASERSRIQER